ncbi:hypothetical protein Hypma_014985 [Hypsizygus marmoreus]|uniref:Uncharacterized protein n=1 Tax=Hypsizygus marmoreus TaxID=39966 RepID=A0A369KC94_HYPMA|nr:hypothetical protein Hypma_014985 [Hypsizygus marmoreus]
MQRDDNRRTAAHRENGPIEKTFLKSCRDWIYLKGNGVKSAAVERMLSLKSLVPTVNAFSALEKFGFNIHKALIVDFMHEFELGVWKALFTHLIRILTAHGASTVQEFNKRFRAVPTFGRSTVRRFSDDVSALKKLAARNFEDLLQCAIPVFEGLLPEPYNGEILSLLWTCAEWHTLAKLRLHTEATLNLLEKTTVEIGRQLRRFTSFTCGAFATKELPKEAAARGRRKARKKARTAPASAGVNELPPDAQPNLSTAAGVNELPPDTQSNPSTTATSAPKPPSLPKKKIFNLFTYKLHALGDYFRTIRWFGTTDSYSTQPGELEHRRVKRFYVRTNKNRAVRQMTRLERRERVLQKLARKRKRRSSPSPTPTKVTSKKKTTVDVAESEALPYTTPDLHHHISPSRNFPLPITRFLADNRDDPAVKGFLPKLQDHLLGRLMHPDSSYIGRGSEYTREEQVRVLFVGNRIYRHKVLRVNFTTYDVRRGQDSMNPRNHADVMILTRDEDATHPFEYARIIGVFHTDVVLTAPGANRAPASLEFLFVRWFRLDPTHRAGFKRKRLPRLEFHPSTDEGAFGFLNPDEVIRGAHLIPAFSFGGTDELLEGESLARAEGEVDDWRYYYVNIFVDRDMYMRHLGGGVGHYRVPIPVEDDVPDILPTGDEPVITVPDPDEESSGDDDEEEEEEEEEEGIDVDADDDLGIEDGEGGYVDAEDEEGYAPL